MSQEEQDKEKAAETLPETPPKTPEKTPAPTEDTAAQQQGQEDDDLEVLDLEAEELARLSDDSFSDYATPKLKELLQSSDSPSRFMAILSIAFAVLAAACFGLLIAMYIRSRNVQKPVHTEEKIEIAAPITQSLNQFKLFIKSESPITPERELRVDIVAECTTAEACETLKEHLPEARDVVFPVLSVTTQEEWMRVESKTLIRRKITDRLNSLKLQGKVLQVNFTDMTIETGK